MSAAAIWAAVRAWRLWRGLGGVWRWLIADQWRLAAVALGLALVIDHTGAHRRDRQWAAAFARMQRAYTVTTDALIRQNAAVDRWRIAAQARKDAATRALASARQDNRSLLAGAARIEQAAPSHGGGTAPTDQCTTPPEVLAAKGDL
ncbi:hypothetical protein GTZ99_03115 [Novosphingobium sp. FSY-8]|uniref:Uncharacterized protein n=1 Tax=Novosphingobium ovatum TaxID=1908523 RepID=A0ABW9XAK9_9SPHN|nr:hypothetical protein [Novosphingobium ovatum]NBC35542.1 hypothetical protein [Novosphingobium ovatum]